MSNKTQTPAPATAKISKEEAFKNRAAVMEKVQKLEEAQRKATRDLVNSRKELVTAKNAWREASGAANHELSEMAFYQMLLVNKK